MGTFIAYSCYLIYLYFLEIDVFLGLFMRLFFITIIIIYNYLAYCFNVKKPTISRNENLTSLAAKIVQSSPGEVQ